MYHIPRNVHSRKSILKNIGIRELALLFGSSLMGITLFYLSGLFLNNVLRGVVSVIFITVSFFIIFIYLLTKYSIVDYYNWKKRQNLYLYQVDNEVVKGSDDYRTELIS